MGTEFLQENSKPICAVVDTSIWRAEPLLKTPLGVTLVYTLHRRGGVVGLPEIVELELKGQIVESGLEAATKAERHLHMLHTITNDGFINAVLSQYTADAVSEKLAQKVDERITELSSILIREPFTIEHAKAALAMVNAKLPPSGKNQQFKDCAIWQAVLALSLQYSTVLLTDDRSFFHDKKTDKGLAKNLVEDCMKANVDVKCFSGIGPYLKTLEDDKPIFDENIVKAKVFPLAMQRVNIEAERRHTIPTEPFEFTFQAFPTEDPNRLAIDYSCTFNLVCTRDMGAVLGVPDRGIVHGSAYFFPGDNNLTEHYVQRVLLKGRGSTSVREFKDYDNAFVIPRPLSWD